MPCVWVSESRTTPFGKGSTTTSPMATAASTSAWSLWRRVWAALDISQMVTAGASNRASVGPVTVRIPAVTPLAVAPSRHDPRSRSSRSTAVLSNKSERRFCDPLSLCVWNDRGVDLCEHRLSICQRLLTFGTRVRRDDHLQIDVLRHERASILKNAAIVAEFADVPAPSLDASTDVLDIDDLERPRTAELHHFVCDDGEVASEVKLLVTPNAKGWSLLQDVFIETSNEVRPTNVCDNALLR
jgi:hypothetical protein